MMEAARIGPCLDNPAADRAVFCPEMAAKARAKAEAMMDYEARRTMLEVAALWDTMAKNAERNARDRTTF
jgi:hypothetical protein